MIDETRRPGADESQGPELDESGEFILATYREIAARFTLGGPNAARTKAKRAGWHNGPCPNHPADPLRIQVPREAWDQVSETSHRTPHERRSRPTRESAPRDPEPPFQDREIPHLRAMIALLREQVERERLIADEARAGRAAAELRATRAEDDLRAERDWSRRQSEELGRLIALQPGSMKPAGLPSIREGLAELAAEFMAPSMEPPLAAEPTSLSPILDGLSELMAEFSVSPPGPLSPPTPAETPMQTAEPPEARVDELRAEEAPRLAAELEAEGRVEPPIVLPIKHDQAKVEMLAGAMSARPVVKREPAHEPPPLSPLQQAPMPVMSVQRRPWWQFRRSGAS
jgi:hypothetical protein